MPVTVVKLMDGVEPGVVEAMTTTAASVPGVRGVDRMRVRWTGHRHLEAVTVHLHPVLDGVEMSDLHELSGHHVSTEAREEYRRRQRVAST